MQHRPSISKFIATLSLVVLAGGILVNVASAHSLKEIRGQESENAALDREAAYTQSVCRSSINATIDWRSAAEWPDDASIVASCDGALGALEAICRSNSGRVKAQQVTQFTCAGDGSGASFHRGTLRYGASPGDNGYSDTKALLESVL